MPEAEPLQGDVSEEELIPAEDDQLTTYQRGVFNFDNDASKIMLNNDITFDDLMFQLFYRDLLTDEIKEQVNDEPNDIRKKQFFFRNYTRNDERRQMVSISKSKKIKV